MSSPLNSVDTLNATSSPALADGPTPCGSPGGRQIDLSGPAVVHANRSAQPGTDSEKKTSGICGPSSTGSSASAARRSSSASKSHPQKLSALSLRLLSLSRFAGATTPEPTNSPNDSLKASLSTTIAGGSMEYNETWKRLVTPSGSPYWEHTASGRRTSAKGFTGWPTPRTPTGGAESAERKQGLGRTESGGSDLQATAQTAGWPTPMAGSPGTEQYNEAGDTCNGRQTRLLASGPTPDGTNAPMENCAGFRLNPRFSLWLQGYPDEWASCGERVMQSCRKSRPNLSKRRATHSAKSRQQET